MVHPHEIWYSWKKMQDALLDAGGELSVLNEDVDWDMVADLEEHHNDKLEVLHGDKLVLRLKSDVSHEPLDLALRNLDESRKQPFTPPGQRDEKLLVDNGWYPLDDRMMTWAHSEHTESEPVSRLTALKFARNLAKQSFDYKSGGEWSES